MGTLVAASGSALTKTLSRRAELRIKREVGGGDAAQAETMMDARAGEA